jgi:hypothetical protein
VGLGGDVLQVIRPEEGWDPNPYLPGIVRTTPTEGEQQEQGWVMPCAHIVSVSVTYTLIRGARR